MIFLSFNHWSYTTLYDCERSAQLFCDIKHCLQKWRDSHDIWQSFLIGTTLHTSNTKSELTTAHAAVFAIYFVRACDFSLKFLLTITLKAENLSQCFIPFGKGPITGMQNNYSVLLEDCGICCMYISYLMCIFFIFLLY